MDENEMMNTLIGALGGTPATETTETTETESTETTEQVETTETQTETTETTEEPATPTEETVEETESAQSSPDKSTQAFIHMRQANKSMRNMLNDIASVLGIKDQNDEQIMTALQARITDAQAKQNNVPPELMQRLNDLEQRDRAHTAEQRQRDTAIGFQRVAEKFKLDQKGLNQFAQDLVKANINPLEQEVDLVREYKLMHYDDEVKKAVDAAVAAEQARAAKAAKQSSTPSNTTSGPNNSTGPEKINSIRDLENWMRSTQQ